MYNGDPSLCLNLNAGESALRTKGLHLPGSMGLLGYSMSKACEKAYEDRTGDHTRLLLQLVSEVPM